MFGEPLAADMIEKKVHTVIGLRLVNIKRTMLACVMEVVRHFFDLRAKAIPFSQAKEIDEAGKEF